jgi:beta-lactamase class A
MIRICIAFIIASIPVMAQSQNQKALQTLKQQVSDTLAGQKGIFAIAFKDLSTGDQLFINEHDIFHAASTMKTPVLIEVYKQAREKKFSLTDSILIKNEFKSIVDSSLYSLDSADDSEFELYKQIGNKRTIHDLVYLMIIASSNFATNMMIQLVGAQNVTQTMRSIGAKDIQVLRGVEDQKAFDKGLNNTVTAYDLMLVFENIATGKIVNKKSCDDMIKILLDQKFNDIIPAKLPADIRVAHKTGWITGVHHDSGIVFLPNRKKYVLVILSKNLENEKAAVDAMASISKMIYDFASRQ